MQNSKYSLTKQKSLRERFLFVISVLFLLVYIALGLMVMFWQKLPLNMTQNIRYVFGLLLIGYAALRFSRMIKSFKDE